MDYVTSVHPMYNRKHGRFLFVEAWAERGGDSRIRWSTWEVCLSSVDLVFRDTSWVSGGVALWKLSVCTRQHTPVQFACRRRRRRRRIYFHRRRRSANSRRCKMFGFARPCPMTVVLSQYNHVGILYERCVSSAGPNVAWLHRYDTTQLSATCPVVESLTPGKWMCPKAKRAEHDMHITIDSIVVETLTELLYFILNYISYQANQKRHNRIIVM